MFFIIKQISQIVIIMMTLEVAAALIHSSLLFQKELWAGTQGGSCSCVVFFFKYKSTIKLHNT